MDRKKAILIGVTAVTVVFCLLAANEIRIVVSPQMKLQVARAAQSKEMPNVFMYRLSVWLAACGTLAVYSFMFKDNPAYRGFQNLLQGCATGWGCVLVTNQILLKKFLLPMSQGFSSLATDGFSSVALNHALLIVPGVIGSLWYFQYSKRYFWISRIAMCVTLGAGAGLSFKKTFNELLPQITGSFKSLWPSEYLLPGVTTYERFAAGFENLLFIVTMLSVLSYFFFAFERKSLVLNSSAGLGRWFLMISLGAFFGNTFMTRLSALIERVHFLVAEWLRLVAM